MFEPYRWHLHEAYVQQPLVGTRQPRLGMIQHAMVQQLTHGQPKKKVKEKEQC